MVKRNTTLAELRINILVALIVVAIVTAGAFFVAW